MAKSIRRGIGGADKDVEESLGCMRGLPAARAFVVQLPSGDLHGKPVSGRVEHVLSGRSTRFEGLEHLAAFFAEVLSTEGQRADEADGE